jgi:hypothetical protein
MIRTQIVRCDYGPNTYYIIQQYKRGWLPWSKLKWRTAHVFGIPVRYYALDHAESQMHLYDGTKVTQTPV